MALVDANYEFIYVDIGTNGRVSDGGVWGNCTLCHILKNNTAGLPPPAQLAHSDRTLPYVVVGDDAFPLQTYLMKPFPFRNQTNEQRIFSYRLSRARRTAENAFGIMANKFRVFLSPIHLSPSKTEKITLACTALHNLLRRQFANDYSPPGSLDTECEENGTVSLGNWRQEHTMLALENIPRRPSPDAKMVREEFMQYFVHEGSVCWQNAMIGINEH